MATHCDDVSARMVDLLYGELSADERAEIDAHVAGCERCRSELEGFEKTRAVARQALDEEPPARVRAAILKAAAAHVAGQAQPAARQAAAAERVSFWDRLRVRWAFPTLATVGALAVFLVANRVFMHPEATMEKAQEAVQPSAVRSAPPVAHRPLERMVPDSAKAEEEAAPRPAPMTGDRYDETAQQGARFAGRDKRALEPPADRPGGAPKPVAASGSVAGYGDLSKDSAGASAAKPRLAAPAQKPRAIRDSPLDGLLPEGASARSASGADNEKQHRRAERQFAPPPPPREEPVAKQRAKETDKAAAPTMKKTASDDPFDSLPRESSPAGGGASGPAVGGAIGGRKNKADDYGGPAAQPAPEVAAKAEAPKRPSPAVAAARPPAPAPVAASAPAAPPPPPLSAPAATAHGKGGESYDAEDVPLARDADSRAEKKKKAGGKAAPAETLAQRADRLFSEGRWAEAAAAYRELLRRDPRNEDADRWRRSLAQAENADVSDRNASLAEKRAAEAKPAKAAAPKAAKAPSKKASSVLDADQ